jgi:hypothetical protein
MVGGLFPNALYTVSGFSLPPISDRHHITEKLLNMAKNSKQSINQSNTCVSPAYGVYVYLFDMQKHVLRMMNI